MPGIRITQGSDLKLTNLRFSLDPSIEVAPPVAHLRMDMYRHWLLEAIEGAAAAREAAAAVSAAHCSSDDVEVARQMDRELRASMRAIASAAFALDALYATVKSRSPAHPHEAVWKRKRTARTKQILETFRRCLGLRHAGAVALGDLLDEVFRFRGWAVHPGSQFAEPVHRADVDSGVDWHYIAFRAENAISAVAKVVQAIDALTVVMYRGSPDLREHKPAARSFLQEVRGAYEAASLPDIEWAQDRDEDLPSPA